MFWGSFWWIHIHVWTLNFFVVLEKEVELCSPRTPPSELFTREMAHRTRSSDRRMTLQPTAITEISSGSVGFEPGAEWTWRLNYTLVSKESTTFRMRQNIWDSNAALCFALHPSELPIPAPGTCIKSTSKYPFLLQPQMQGHKIILLEFPEATGSSVRDFIQLFCNVEQFFCASHLTQTYLDTHLYTYPCLAFR